MNKEIKRRSRVVGIFPNDAAIVRLVGALLIEQTEEWHITRRNMSQDSLAGEDHGIRLQADDRGRAGGLAHILEIPELHHLHGRYHPGAADVAGGLPRLPGYAPPDWAASPLPCPPISIVSG